MEHRIEPRFNLRHPVKVTILGEQHITMDAEVANLSGRGLRLVASKEVPMDAPVRIDLKDSLLLGEVVYCQNIGPEWAIGIELQHSLSHLASLEEIVESVLREERKSRSGESRPAGSRPKR